MDQPRLERGASFRCFCQNHLFVLSTGSSLTGMHGHMGVTPISLLLLSSPFVCGIYWELLYPRNIPEIDLPVLSVLKIAPLQSWKNMDTTIFVPGMELF